MVDYAYINIWSTRVGVVTWNNQRMLADFQFDKPFLEKGWDLSPLKMPIELAIAAPICNGSIESSRKACWINFHISVSLSIVNVEKVSSIAVRVRISWNERVISRVVS